MIASGSVPGADSLGFFDGPRCSNRGAFVLRTAKSAVVVCALGRGYIYEGRRLSDDGRITLPAQLVENGFIAVNPSDGTTYGVTGSGLAITTNGDIYSEEATAVGP